MEEKQIVNYWRIAFFVLLLIFFSILYKSLTTLPSSGDSLDYHIPIAKSFIDGTVLNPHRGGYDLLFYPGISNGLLVPFLLFHIPLNLFNIAGTIFFLWSLYFLARKNNFSTRLSLLYASVIVAVPTVVRTMDTQGIDILLGAYFALILAFVSQKKLTDRHFLILGILIGLVIGTKYSGPAYIIVILLFFVNELVRQLNIKRIILMIVPTFVLGFSWYIRNYILTNNPIYPGHLLMFHGNPTFHLQNWYPLKTITQGVPGLILFLQALFSEYQLLSVLLFILPVLLLKIKTSSFIKKLILIGIINFIIYLILPSWPENIISDMRYNYVVFIPLVLALFMMFKSTKYMPIVYLFSVFSIVYTITYLGHRPKVLLLAVGTFLLLYMVKRTRYLFKL